MKTKLLTHFYVDLRGEVAPFGTCFEGLSLFCMFEDDVRALDAKERLMRMVEALRPDAHAGRAIGGGRTISTACGRKF